MKFRKEVDLPETGLRLSREDKVGVFGSCFAWEVADHLEDDLHDVWRSPFGISYNPLSMAAQLHRLCTNTQISEDELIQTDGTWHSFAHHGSYSDASRSSALEGMQRAFAHAVEELRATKLFIFTWGTAYYYRLLESGTVANNCHKMPSTLFQRQKSTIEEIKNLWHRTLDELRSIAPEAQFLFTISPVPHYSDGIHEHTVSKSILHCSLDALMEEGEKQIVYFPAYEIMREELRDYRFYKEDFAHPTPQAVQFIMEKFCKAYTYSDSEIDRRWQSLRGQLNHRPLTSDREKLKAHYARLLDGVLSLQNSLSHPRLSYEAERLQVLLSSL